MKVPQWLVSVRYAPEGVRDFQRRAVVGPAHSSTIEAALRLACVPETVCAEIRADAVVQKFVEGQLDFESYGYYVPCPMPTSCGWLVCIGPVHEVLSPG